MKYHCTAFFLGFLLDLLLGDPYFLPHPIRLIGRMITRAEQRLFGEYTVGREADAENGSGENAKRAGREFRGGICLVCLILGGTGMVSFFLLYMAYCIHPFLGMAAETVMTYQILAAKCLKVESMKVYAGLKNREMEEARAALSMIVGRDTANLDEEGIAKAAVETVAENTSDGVIAPMLYTALGGPVLGFLYKAVNTMDSMVGYKNERYLFFGRPAAKLDDVVNFIPARISAWLMIAAAFAGGRDFSGKRAVRIWLRDKRKHASPNAAQTEAVCAGALGIRLAGNASYFGRTVEKPYIGDDLRRVECEDIARADRLMYRTAWLGEALCLLAMALFYL